MTGSSWLATPFAKASQRHERLILETPPMLKTKLRVLRPLLSLLLLCFAPREAASQSFEAFCALREPGREIRLLAPDYRRFRSLVRTITTESRAKILKEVPFSMHFDELGQHTLYVVRGEKEFIGYVHVRSESFKWGLVRIVWLMNTDLEITSYRFQRCRSPWRSELESSAVSERIIGKTMRELTGMLSQDGSRLRPGDASVSEGARELMAVLVQSAIKTRVVTEIVWAREVGSIKAASLTHELFDGGGRVSQHLDLYDERVQAALAQRGLAESIGFDRSRMFRWRVVDQAGAFRGSVFCTYWSAGDERAKLWWVLTADHRILAVEDTQRSLEPLTSNLFQKLVGRQFGGEEECKTACELAALEITLLNTQD